MAISHQFLALLHSKFQKQTVKKPQIKFFKNPIKKPETDKLEN